MIAAAGPRTDEPSPRCLAAMLGFALDCASAFRRARSASNRSRHSPLLNARALLVHVAGALVVARPEKDRLTQLSVRRPLGEFYLHDGHRPHPVDRLARSNQVGER